MKTNVNFGTIKMQLKALSQERLNRALDHKIYLVDSELNAESREPEIRGDKSRVDMSRGCGNRGDEKRITCEIIARSMSYGDERTQDKDTVKDLGTETYIVNQQGTDVLEESVQGNLTNTYEGESRVNCVESGSFV